MFKIVQVENGHFSSFLGACNQLTCQRVAQLRKPLILTNPV